VASDADAASKAAETAKNAAKVANKVAKHSVKLADNAKESLRKAHEAIQKARVDSSGLSGSQKQYLKKAEAKLREATKKAEYGQIKNAKYVKVGVENKRLQKMEKKMQKIKKEVKTKKVVEIEQEKSTVADEELEAMRKEIKELREELKRKEGEKAEDDALLQELQDQIEQMEAAEKKEGKSQKTHDELKSEIEKLREQIKDMQDEPKEESEPANPPPPAVKEVKVEKYKVNMEPLDKPEAEPKEEEEEEEEQQQQGDATPVESKGLDIDTGMPYGDLEPFGREDTAQELTEASVKESDGMVDQLERAEVAEEKRAVFRALTRLRGAAITSFDGVARSQTGNIDEYNKIHQWRKTHPLHHLADEESDVSKWAFPDNADF